ncbi:hypothetical protein HYS54_01210 [Candidatus Micrarchaeota archaeon]|nr:hypothetical protein [Candidatus Micrarchaeota archaeon]
MRLPLPKWLSGFHRKPPFPVARPATGGALIPPSRIRPLPPLARQPKTVPFGTYTQPPKRPKPAARIRLTREEGLTVAHTVPEAGHPRKHSVSHALQRDRLRRAMVAIIGEEIRTKGRLTLSENELYDRARQQANPTSTAKQPASPRAPAATRSSPGELDPETERMLQRLLSREVKKTG